MSGIRMKKNDKVVSHEKSKAIRSNIKLYNVIKKTFDIVISATALVILFPAFVLLAILIRIDTRGPIFFKHKRLGKNGKEIMIYKFRTMVTNAEEILKNISDDKKREFEINFKFEEDPRITYIGKILRITSLDELPQFLNILKGELSLVGPRPIVKDELKKYGEYSNKFLSVRPGLTGYWQVSGRNDTTYEERVMLDMYYIDNRSIFFDLIIVLKTFKAVLKKAGAR